jgi:hypothetical protein
MCTLSRTPPGWCDTGHQRLPAIFLMAASFSYLRLRFVVVGTGVAIALVDWLRITITAAEEAEARVAADLRDMTQLNQLSNRLVREGSDHAGNLNAVVDTAIAITGAFKGTLRLLDPTNGVLPSLRGVDLKSLS